MVGERRMLACPEEPECSTRVLGRPWVALGALGAGRPRGGASAAHPQRALGAGRPRRGIRSWAPNLKIG